MMANYRQIHVSIWKDCWFLDLEPQEKLLFIYLFSNSETSLAGIYKIPFKVICFETGLSGEFVQTAIDTFTEDGKVMYENGVMWVKNMMKFHSSKSPKVQTRIDNDLKNIPNCNVKIQYLYTIDTGSQEEEDKEEDKDIEENKIKSNTIASAAMKEALETWQELFPNKPQPRATTKSLQTKWNTRYKEKHFQDNWRQALQAASQSPALQATSWFNFNFFIRNDENYQKCLDGWMAWKDEQGSDRVEVVNDEWTAYMKKHRSKADGE